MATHVDVRRMLNNDDRLTSVFLTFSSRLDCDDFRKAIATNTILEEVFISADDTFFRDYPEEVFQDTLDALGRLPRLRKLSINSYPNCHGVVSMRSINQMVKSAKSLQFLSISDLQLIGRPEEFAKFAEQVQQMFFLTTFCLTGCNAVLHQSRSSTTTTSSPPSPTATSEVLQKIPQASSLSSVSSSDAAVVVDAGLLDSLLMSLSILPFLQIVNLEAKDKGGLGRVSVPSATSLCLSASIRIAKIRNLDLSDAHVTSMASILETNQTIQSLDLGAMTDFKTPAARAIGKMIRSNTSLIHLELCMDKIIQEDCADILAKALRHNRYLRSFALVPRGRDPKKSLHKQRLSTKARKSMQEMLRFNYTLQKFFLFRKSPLINREVKLYSNLNKLGRGELLQSRQVNRPEAWIQKLDSVKNDLDSIFYFLSSNPTLCMTTTQTTGPTKRKSLPPVRRDDNDDTAEPAPKKRRRI